MGSAAPEGILPCIIDTTWPMERGR